MIDYAARRFREEVSRWRDGVYESDVYVDHDPKGNKDIHIHCKVTVKGDRLRVDFSGSDTRDHLAAYSTFGNTRGYVVAQIASMMDPAIPKNEGFFNSIELIVPAGCCLNPPPNRSVAAGTHHPGTEVGEAIAKALEQVIPERCCPQIYKMGMPTVIFGTNPKTGQLFIDHSVDTFAAYCGAVKGQDGWGAMNVSFGNLIRATGEINESIFPVRHLCARLRHRYRRTGRMARVPGLALRQAVLAPSTDLYLRRRHASTRCPALPAAVRAHPTSYACARGTAREQLVETTAFYVQHEAGDRYEYHYGGGGGWGDPLARDPQQVLDDVLDEYVSVEAARRDYGVVLTGDLWELTLAIDHEATARLRDEMRAARG